MSEKFKQKPQNHFDFIDFKVFRVHTSENSALHYIFKSLLRALFCTAICLIQKQAKNYYRQSEDAPIEILSSAQNCFLRGYQMSQFECKLFAALNEKIDAEKVMSALAHAATGAGQKTGAENLTFFK